MIGVTWDRVMAARTVRDGWSPGIFFPMVLLMCNLLKVKFTLLGVHL